MSEVKWKHSIDYYAYKAIYLERDNVELQAERERLHSVIETLNEKRPKKVSNFFVVFKISDGKYHSPEIVEADSPEEALCPEGCDEPRGEFCHRLYEKSEYGEL